MTEQAVPSLRRRRARRTTITAGAVLLLSLSVSPGAQADEGDGLLGGVTDPVVEPVVEVVQSAVPQPVQQPVQQVVAPVVEQVEQAVAPVPGGERATQPVVTAVESVVRPADKPREEGGGGQHAPVPGPEPASTPTAHPATGPVSSSAPEGAGPGSSGQDAPTSDGTRHGQGPAGWEPCDGLTDLPPRGTATPATALEPGTSAASGSWDVVDTLLARSGAVEPSAADRSRASDLRQPDGRLTDVPWFDSRGGFDVPGRSGTVPLLSGLVALLGLVLVGLALARSRQRA